MSEARPRPTFRRVQAYDASATAPGPGPHPPHGGLTEPMLKVDLKIKPVKVGFAAFYEELGRVGLVDEYGPRGFKQVSISGRELRETLRSGQLPDPRTSRPEREKTPEEGMRRTACGARSRISEVPFGVSSFRAPRAPASAKR